MPHACTTRPVAAVRVELQRYKRACVSERCVSCAVCRMHKCRMHTTHRRYKRMHTTYRRYKRVVCIRHTGATNVSMLRREEKTLVASADNTQRSDTQRSRSVSRRHTALYADGTSVALTTHSALCRRVEALQACRLDTLEEVAFQPPPPQPLPPPPPLPLSPLSRTPSLSLSRSPSLSLTRHAARDACCACSQMRAQGLRTQLSKEAGCKHNSVRQAHQRACERASFPQRLAQRRARQATARVALCKHRSTHAGTHATRLVLLGSSASETQTVAFRDAGTRLFLLASSASESKCLLCFASKQARSRVSLCKLFETRALRAACKRTRLSMQAYLST